MARLTPESVRQVIEHIDIVELISKSVSLKIKGQEAIGICPFHNEKSPSFTVSRKKQFYYCFGCHAKGNCIDYIMQSQKLSFPEAVESLAQNYNIAIHYTEETKQNPTPSVSLPLVLSLMHDAYKLYIKNLTQEPEVINYCKNRGISGSTAQAFGLGYATETPNLGGLTKHPLDVRHASGLWNPSLGKERFHNRLMFPIINPQGKIIAFGGRTMTDDAQPKYLNSPETPLFHKSKVVFGIYQALKHPISQWLVVEGYMDVIICHQHGFTQAVATLGTAFTLHHFKQLTRYARTLIFCFDGDSAGMRALDRTMDILLEHITDTHDIRAILLPDNHDPDSFLTQYGKQALQEHITQAMNWETYWETFWSRDLKLSDLHDTAVYLQRAEASFKRMPNSYLKQLWLKKIETQTNIAITLEPLPPTAPQPFIHDNIFKDTLYWLMEKPELIASFTSALQEYPAHHPTLTLLLHWMRSENFDKKHTGQWIEASRDTPLTELIQQALDLEAKWAVPFTDCIARIKKLALDYSIQQLLSLTSRNADQNSQLRALLALKHEPRLPSA